MAPENCPCDLLAGTLVQIDEAQRTILLVGAPPGDGPSKVLHQGDTLVCYALAFLYEQDWLIPDYALDDFRRSYAGREALAFIINKGDLFPRGDARGVRISTGRREELFIKQLDLARPVAAFAYPTGGADRPLARLDAVVWVEPGLPAWSPLPLDDSRSSTWLRQAVRLYRIPPAELEFLEDLVQSGLS